MDKKLKKHQDDSYLKHEYLNLRKESKRLEILTFLKPPCPFTKPIEVKSFMKSNITKKEKERCIKRVKYACITCTIMKESHASD